MMIRLKDITEDNFEECINLRVSEEQSKFIASNAYSLCEAYALTNHEFYVPLPYAIYYKKTMIGFTMFVYQPMDDDDPHDDEDIYYLSRIMIDKKYQGLGYGKLALKKVINFIKTFPQGEADAIVLSCNPKNEPAYSLFKSFGFMEIITDSDGDKLLRLDL